MNEELKKIVRKRQIIGLHIVMYLAMFVYSTTLFFSVEDYFVWRYGIDCAVAGIMIIWDICAANGKPKWFNNQWVELFYHLIRMIVMTVFYFGAPEGTNNAVYLVLSVMFAMEAMCFVPFDGVMQKIMCYAVFGLLYGGATIILFMRLLNDTANVYEKISYSIREIVLHVIVICIVIAIGEILTGVLNYFEKHIFAQNRMVRELNDSNDVLQEHQEKIKKVNEMLGMQKIELQAANKRINRSHDEMSVQNAISSTIAASVGKEEAWQQITQIIQVRLDMDVAMILIEPDLSLMVPGEEPAGRFVALTSNQGPTFEENIIKSAKETDLKELMFLTSTYIQNDYAQTAKFFEYLTEEQEMPSVICLPIINQEERLGTLVVGKKKEDAFMEGKAFYENIASQLSIGIANARLYARMNDMAIRDGLTRIYNRRHLTELLNEYLHEAMTEKTSVSMALLDIDKFKMINDTYGHQCGDEVIKYIARTINTYAIKNGGIAGRYGGEEFVIAFLDKGLDETYQIIKALHTQIRNSILRYGKKELDVRVSVGVASYPETCANPGVILTRADWAMYHSKQNGRDRITIDSDKISAKM